MSLISAAKKLLFAVFLLLGLSFLIWRTDDDAWLTLWFILFFFVGIPLLLLGIRDALVSIKPRWMGRGPLLLHTCAVFAALVGYFVGWMAVDSEHPKAHLHQAMIILFPLFVYATPLLMLFHGLHVSELKKFYYKSDDEGDT